MLNIAICKNRKDKVYKNQEISFENLIEKLKTTTYTKETYKEYLNLPKEHQDNIKDVEFRFIHIKKAHLMEDL
ncbi:hypothetical protein QOZ84_10275 [Romboutsia sedimentorum]|uniref:Uncharacterized protein n=1 Tax=Romboutsia sedimentorum TaxID=1368474 RepID=A0ABT7EAI1_9FIRM|nr:hypothetical protein [Romboutsia sedimentorum]MDK2563937.1 hypothetical protein [Romboutsia sedimentorum]MDK2585327.1 hypothetical protein [Romboutsia sedimentorum]